MYFLGMIHASQRDSVLKDFAKKFPGYWAETEPAQFRNPNERLLDLFAEVQDREMRPCMVDWLTKHEAFRR